MDRYGASTREFESDFVYDYPRRGGPVDRDNDGFGYDYPSHGGPLDSDNDCDRSYGHGGQRSGRVHTSGFDDEDADFGRYDRPTHRGLHDRSGTDPYASDASEDDYESEPRNRYRGRAGRVCGSTPRRRGLSPDSLDGENDDSEFEHAGREIRGQGSRRGALSHHPDPRFSGEYSEDESEIEPRATRGRLSGPRLRRSMAASSADHRGPAHASSDDDESEYERPRRGYGRDVRGGMHPRRRGHDTLSGSDSDDSEGEGMRGGRRAVPGFGGSSRREFY